MMTLFKEVRLVAIRISMTILLQLAIILLISLPADAIQITTEEQIADYQLQTTESDAELSQPLLFNQFDASLGQLSSINISIQYGGIMSANMSGNHEIGGTSVQSHGITFRSRLGLLEPVLGIDRGDFAGLMAELSCITTDSGLLLCEDNDYKTNLNNLPLQLRIDDTNFLNAWVGTGTIAIAPSVRNWISDQFGMVTDYGVMTDWQGTITLTYTYNDSAAVPEQATVLLLGFGLAGVGLFRRRFTK